MANSNSGVTRVLMVIPEAGPGGVERVSLDLMLECSAQYQCSAHFLRDGPYVEEARSSGIECTVATDRRTTDPLWRRVRAATRVINRARPDVVHVNGVVPLLEMLVAGRLTRTPVVWHLQDPYTATGFHARKLLAAVTAVPPAATIFGTQVAMTSVSRRIPTLRRVELITNGVAPPRDMSLSPGAARTKLGIDPDAPLVTMLGRVATLKRPENLIRAAPAILARHANATFVIAGPCTPEREAELRSLATDLGVDSQIRITGPIDDALKWGVLSATDVFVHPSAHEPFGLVIVEAMLAGTPVVAADSWGPAWIVQPDVTGLLVGVDDVDALATSVNQLLDSPELVRQVTEAARADAEERFLFDVTVARVEAVWSAVAARRRSLRS